jgi:peptidoglycan/LPS O-acetylase OafA/YrhL
MLDNLKYYINSSSVCTVQSALQKNKGFGTGFDFLRVTLALLIVLFHSAVVTGALEEAIGGPFWLGIYILVPMFFALSGFLITGSALRLSLANFLLNRSLRIIPALAVEILVSALIIGPFFTTVPLREYFSRHEFFSYFANIVGYIHYQLPGVFLSNSSAGVVNISLWTVPYEIVCYIAMAGMILSGLLVRRGALVALLFIALTFGATLQFFGVTHFDIPLVDKLLSILFFSRGSLALACFISGCVAYLFREFIVINRAFFILVVATCVLIAAVGNPEWRAPLLNILLCPLITYATIYIGVSSAPTLPVYHRGDYSYGIYLYAYPIQQAIVEIVPNWRTVIVHFFISASLATAIAVVSWHKIEKPILLLRRNFSFIGRKVAEEERN